MPSPKQRQRQRELEAQLQRNLAREQARPRDPLAGIAFDPEAVAKMQEDVIDSNLRKLLAGYGLDVVTHGQGGVGYTEEDAHGLFQQRAPQHDPIAEMRKAQGIVQKVTGSKPNTIVLHTQEGGGSVDSSKAQPAKNPGSWLSNGANLQGRRPQLSARGDSYTMQSNPMVESIRELVVRVDRLEADNKKLKRRVLRLEGEKKVGPTARKRTNTEGTE